VNPGFEGMCPVHGHYKNDTDECPFCANDAEDYYPEGWDPVEGADEEVEDALQDAIHDFVERYIDLDEEEARRGSRL